MVKRGQTVKLFVGELDGEEVDSIHNQERARPQVGGNTCILTRATIRVGPSR